MYLRRVELMTDKIDHPGQYPFHIPSIESLDRLEFSHNVTFFVGENGSGKSTPPKASLISVGSTLPGAGAITILRHMRQSLGLETT